MKIFHLSDLHIGMKLFNRDLQEDQRYIFDQMVDLAEKHRPDAVLIAGDIYDRAIPSAEAVELFDSFVNKLMKTLPGAEIMMISGNHDSAPRVNMYRQVLQRQHLHMIGMPPQLPEEYIEKVTLQDTYGNINFYLLPFVKPSFVKRIVGVDVNGNNLSYNDTVHKLIAREHINTNERNVLVSHQFYLPMGQSADDVERMDSEMRTVGNIDEVKADVLDIFDYAALGHIHKPMCVGNSNYRYSGTPLAYSATEAEHDKGVLMVELGDKGEVKVEHLPLSPLRRLRVLHGSLEELIKQTSEDFVIIILTDKVDLDVIDMHDRLRNAYPNVLEIRREFLRKADYKMEFSGEEELNPLELCARFLKDLTEEEEELLRDVINSIQEVN